MTRLRSGFALAALPIVLIVTAGVQAAEPSSTYLRDWLVCGPIQLHGPDPRGENEHHMVGFEENYLAAMGPEAEVRPEEGQTVAYPGGTLTWKRWDSPGDVLDLDAAVDPIDGKLAYAYAEFEADTDHAAIMALGTDDGARVWLNGEMVFNYPMGRALVIDGDLVPVLLRKGTNRILFKVEDEYDTWGISCRFFPMGKGAEWQRAKLFSVRQEGDGPAWLDFLGGSTRPDALITEAWVVVRYRGAEQVAWSMPWTGEAQMALPIDTKNYGEFLLKVDAKFQGGGEGTIHDSFTAGIPVDHVLFSDGKSEYVIVLDQSASESEKWSAVELQRWIEASCGVALPIVEPSDAANHPVLSVGWNARTRAIAGDRARKPEPDAESFAYWNRGPDVAIVGGRKRGTMYGVMAFLENELGIRFYTPDATSVPLKSQFTFRRLRFHDKPGIRVRNDYYYTAFDPTWAARNRVNGALTTREQPGGLESYWSVHTFHPLVPPSEYFESHPEYYSLLNGTRTHELGQLCLTNPEVLDVLTERLKKIMRENPDYLIYSVSQNDWFNPCQCEDCQAVVAREESESGPVLQFVNQVAERIEGEFPDKFIGTLAYQYTRKPPKHIRPRENVVVRLCSIECCFAHEFNSCPQNTEFLTDLRGWAEIAPRIYIWDYIVGFGNYVMPFPNYAVLQPNIQTFRDNNAIGVMEQAASQSLGADFCELKAYLVAKLLWNPDADVEAIVNDFIYGYYGRAGQQIRKYFDLTQSLVTPDTHFSIWIQPNHPIYTEAFIEKSAILFDEAERVAESPEMLARVERSRMPLLYLTCWHRPSQSLRDGTYARLLALKEREGVTHFAEHADEIWDRFTAHMEKAKGE